MTETAESSQVTRQDGDDADADSEESVDDNDEPEPENDEPSSKSSDDHETITAKSKSKRKISIRLEPHQPKKSKFPTVINGGQCRSFQSSWYSKSPWLE